MKLRPPPPGFVDLGAALPRLALRIGYHRDDNFTGAPLPGYGAPGAWLLEPAAHSLAAVERELFSRGLGLICFDAYRPRRATVAMVGWCARAGQQRLLDEGFVSATSWHNVGTAVDVSLTRGAVELDLGTPWDTFTPASRPENAAGEALERRALLGEVMAAHGWKRATTEWWHFRFLAAEGPPRDVPYGADETPEPD